MSSTAHGAVAHVLAKTFATTVHPRAADTWGEIEAREFVFNAFQQYGYFPRTQEFLASTAQGRVHSANIIAVKEGESAKRLIVGAHYDSAPVGEGYSDNATGTGLLLETAARIKSQDTPYTIVFVAFGAEEKGLLGSSYYVRSMNDLERRATIGMIDLDAVAGGTELSVTSRFGGPTWLRDDALSAAQSLGIPLRTSPAGKSSPRGRLHGAQRRPAVRSRGHRHGGVHRDGLGGGRHRPRGHRRGRPPVAQPQRHGGLHRPRLPGTRPATARRSLAPPRDPAHQQTGETPVKLGIVGLPNVGKTTLFNALTHANAAATAYAYTSAESNIGVVAVPDPRLDRLDEVLETPRKVSATIDVVDIAGLAEGASRGEGLGNRFLADIRGVDAVAHVIRVFANPEVAHVRETVDPRADVDLVEMELVLGDLELVERRIDKTRKAARSGDKAARRELATLEGLLAALQQGRLARAVERHPEDVRLVPRARAGQRPARPLRLQHR